MNNMLSDEIVKKGSLFNLNKGFELLVILMLFKSITLYQI